ncbi:MAG TPA: hypothetical protein VH560_09600 [Polyangia bacterium]|jgi:hypothetical protein|nr:hypothetical protein [Polyangia bacterium]
MATTAKTAHKILPHGDLEPLATGVWQVTGALEFPLKRNMTVARLGDGTLLLHSVIAMNDAGMAALDKLGAPSILVVPNAGHRMDAPFYKARYPNLRVVCPASKRAKIEEVVAVDATSEEALPPLGVRLHALDGFKLGELAYELDTPGGKLLIVTDALGNADAPPGLGGWLTAAVAGGVKGRLGVPRFIRLAFTSDKKLARASVQKLAAIGGVAVVTVAHGKAVTDRCDEALIEAAARF